MKQSSGANRARTVAVVLASAAAIIAALAFHAAASANSSAALDKARNAPAIEKARAENLLGKIPLSFEANRGQTDSRVKFLSRGPGYSLFLTPTEAVLALRRSSSPVPLRERTPTARAAIKSMAGEGSASSATKEQVLRMQFAGANPRTTIEGVDPLPGRSNYFIGNDPKKWHTGISTYARVRYRNIYPGIDLVYHGTGQGEMEYDFILAPGANPDAIKLRFVGAKKLVLDRDGNLSIRLADGGAIVHRAPNVYQEHDGKHEKIAGKVVLHGKDTIGFRLGHYDRHRAVYIDPGLVYSTYLGGSGHNSGYGIAVDSSGNAYVTGLAPSLGFPTLNAFQNSSGGSGGNAFVSELSPAAPVPATLSIAPERVSFGRKAVGLTTAQTFKVKAEASSKSPVSVLLQSFTINSSSGDYSLDPATTCAPPQSLAPNETCTVVVDFRPSAATKGLNDDGTITVVSNARTVRPFDGIVHFTGGGK